MNLSPSTAKSALRAQMRQKKKEHTKKQLLQLSFAALSNLQAMPQFQSASTVLLYWSLPDEVATHNFIKKWSNSKTILLPVIVGKNMILRQYTGNMQTGAYNIKEPVSNETAAATIDLAVIPGMAFDTRNHRLGRGAGYYDRFLAAHSVKFKIGLCFPFQLVRQVPSEPFDILMDAVVTA